jgi:hypothetical protein
MSSTHSHHSFPITPQTRDTGYARTVGEHEQMSTPPAKMTPKKKRKGAPKQKTKAETAQQSDVVAERMRIACRVRAHESQSQNGGGGGGDDAAAQQPTTFASAVEVNAGVVFVQYGDERPVEVSESLWLSSFLQLCSPSFTCVYKCLSVSFVVFTTKTRT